MRDKSIDALCNTGYSPIAWNLYHFHRINESLPDIKDIVNLIKTYGDNLNEYGHELNRYFIEYTKKVLISGVADKFHDIANDLLTIDIIFDEIDSTRDRWTISFFNWYTDDPIILNLNDLIIILRNFDFNQVSTSLTEFSSSSVVFDKEEIRKLIAICEKYCGVFQATEDTQYNSVCSYIVEFGLFRRLAISANADTDIKQAYSAFLGMLVNNKHFISINMEPNIETKIEFLHIYVPNNHKEVNDDLLL